MRYKKWALVLGGSSGLGWATAQKLSEKGFNLILLHRDRRVDMPTIESNFEAMRQTGSILVSRNMDVLNPSKKETFLEEVKTHLGEDKISVLVHSVAKGNLKPMHGNESDEVLKTQDFTLTIEAMATSAYDWTQSLLQNELFAEDTRVVAFTSEGSSKPWPGYGAVSAAKAALEAMVRSMALEFAPIGIKVNCIQAGVVDTRSFRMIPNHEYLKKKALKRNPNQRLTQPSDVADVVYLLTRDEAKWITGTVIKVDGGESLR
ncbi:MAG: SDR family oxidoreductase [Bacteroidota bacterium]